MSSEFPAASTRCGTGLPTTVSAGGIEYNTQLACRTHSGVVPLHSFARHAQNGVSLGHQTAQLHTARSVCEARYTCTNQVGVTLRVAYFKAIRARRPRVDELHSTAVQVPQKFQVSERVARSKAACYHARLIVIRGKITTPRTTLPTVSIVNSRDPTLFSPMLQA
jgi:hypothetical protein